MSRRRKSSRNAVLPATASPLPTVTASADTGSNSPSFGASRTVDIRIVAPSQTFAGRLENPDPVLRQFGTWDGICLYDRMFRQFPTLAGVCHLAADRVCAIDRQIIAGDESVGRSREMRDQTRAAFNDLADTHITNKKLALGRSFGYAAAGKADWRVHEATGLLVPHDVYDIPQKYIKFGAKGETRILGEYDSMYGTPLEDQRSVFFYRWGSRWTPYGEGELQDVYLATWYIQNVRQFGMQALELLGRPIPWVEVPDVMDEENYGKLELGLKAQYRYYVITRTSTNRTSVTFPSLNVLANGNAGRSEMEYIRYLYGEIYVRLLGVQMTQDKTGGSRALEDTRLEVISDKTPPASQALDQAWTTGYSDHIWDVNAPNEPRELRPKYKSDTSSSSIDGKALTALIDVGAKLAMNQITAVYAQRLLEAAGIPSDWARDMVSSTVEGRDALAAPAIPPAGPASIDEPLQETA